MSCCRLQKKKVQNIGAGLPPDAAQMDSQTVEPVTKFTYLGSDINSDGHSMTEIHRRLGLANSHYVAAGGVWKQPEHQATTL